LQQFDQEILVYSSLSGRIVRSSQHGPARAGVGFPKAGPWGMGSPTRRFLLLMAQKKIDNPDPFSLICRNGKDLNWFH
jgi:hypothetical protein